MGGGSKGRRSQGRPSISNNGYKPRVNDLVFAAVPGYPTWPAIVRHREHEDAVQLRKQLKNPNMHFVQFYGTYEIMAINQNDLYPFEDFKEQFGNPKKPSQKFKKGMEEITSEDPLFIIRKEQPIEDDQEEESMQIAEGGDEVKLEAPIDEPMKSSKPSKSKPESSKKKKKASAPKDATSTSSSKSEVDSSFQPVPFWGQQRESIDEDEPSLVIDDAQTQENGPKNSSPEKKVKKKKSTSESIAVPKSAKSSDPPKSTLLAPPSKKRKQSKDEENASTAPPSKKPKNGIKIKISRPSGGAKVKSETIQQEERPYVPNDDDIKSGKASKKNGKKENAQVKSEIPDEPMDEDVAEQPAEVSVEINAEDFLHTEHALPDPAMGAVDESAYQDQDDEEDENEASELPGNSIVDDSNTQVQFRDSSLPLPSKSFDASEDVSNAQVSEAPVQTSSGQQASPQLSALNQSDQRNKSPKEAQGSEEQSEVIKNQLTSSDKADSHSAESPRMQSGESNVAKDLQPSTSASSETDSQPQPEIDLNDERIQAKIQEKAKQKEEAKRKKFEEKRKKKLERQKSSEKKDTNRNKQEPNGSKKQLVNGKNGASNENSAKDSNRKPKLPRPSSPEMMKILKNIDYEIWESLPQKGRPDIDRACRALNKLAALNPHPTSQQLIDCSQLLTTIKKLRKYKFSDVIRAKSSFLFDKFKEMLSRTPLSEEAARELLKPPKEMVDPSNNSNEQNSKEETSPAVEESVSANDKEAAIDNSASTSGAKRKSEPEVHYMNLSEVMDVDAINQEEGTGEDPTAAFNDEGPPSEQDGLSVVKQVSDSPPMLPTDAVEDNPEPPSEPASET